MIFYCEIANSQICFRANIITSPLATGTTLASHVPGPVNHLPKMYHCASDHCKSRIDIFHAKPPRLDRVVGVDQVVKIVCRVHGGHLVHEVKLRLGNVRKCWRHRVVAVKRNDVAESGMTLPATGTKLMQRVIGRPAGAGCLPPLSEVVGWQLSEVELWPLS